LGSATIVSVFWVDEDGMRCKRGTTPDTPIIVNPIAEMAPI